MLICCRTTPKSSLVLISSFLLFYSEIQSRYFWTLATFQKTRRPITTFAPASIPICIAVGFPEFNSFCSPVVSTVKLFVVGLFCFVALMLFSPFLFNFYIKFCLFERKKKDTKNTPADIYRFFTESVISFPLLWVFSIFIVSINSF